MAFHPQVFLVGTFLAGVQHSDLSKHVALDSKEERRRNDI